MRTPAGSLNLTPALLDEGYTAAETRNSHDENTLRLTTAVEKAEATLN